VCAPLPGVAPPTGSAPGGAAGKVLAGHGRLLACRELGITEVPTVCLDHLTSAQARVFMIADNRLTEIATWDDQLLAEQLKELSLLDLDFSIELTGFEMGEIDLRIASLEDMAGTRLTIPLMPFPSFPRGRHSANTEICTSSATIVFCAAVPLTRPTSQP
jgi:ParB-like chromosome segregation protein Spo0J